MSLRWGAWLHSERGLMDLHCMAFYHLGNFGTVRKTAARSRLPRLYKDRTCPLGHWGRFVWNPSAPTYITMFWPCILNKPARFGRREIIQRQYVHLAVNAFGEGVLVYRTLGPLRPVFGATQVDFHTEVRCICFF